MFRNLLMRHPLEKSKFYGLALYIGEVLENTVNPACIIRYKVVGRGKRILNPKRLCAGDGSYRAVNGQWRGFA